MIGFVHLFEDFFRDGVVRIPVRVVLHGQPLKGRTDLRGGRSLGQAKDMVVVLHGVVFFLKRSYGILVYANPITFHPKNPLFENVLRSSHTLVNVMLRVFDPKHPPFEASPFEASLIRRIPHSKHPPFEESSRSPTSIKTKPREISQGFVYNKQFKLVLT